MNLHKNREDFKVLIELAAQYFDMPKFYIEKDYRIVSVLKEISNSKFAEKIVFKGGTSLSKAYNIIKRYSEDIDVQFIDYKAISPREEMKSLETYMSASYNVATLDERKERLRATEIQFENFHTEEESPVSENILLEMNFFSNPQPYEKKEIESYISTYLKETGKREFVKEYQLEPIRINTLDFKKTFLEKIFAVLDNSEKYKDNKKEFSSKIRHLYDIYLIYQKEETKDFINSKDFWSLANSITKENDISLERKSFLYSKTPAIKEKNYFEAFSAKYDENMKKLVWEELPKYNNLVEAFKNISTKIVDWELNGRDLSEYNELKENLKEVKVEKGFEKIYEKFSEYKEEIEYLESELSYYLEPDEVLETIGNLENISEFEELECALTNKLEEYREENENDELN